MSVSDIRAASQVGVVDGVGEVKSQLDALGGKRAEDVFADSSGEHGQGVCRRQSNQILLSLPLFHVIRKQLSVYGREVKSTYPVTDFAEISFLCCWQSGSPLNSQ